LSIPLSMLAVLVAAATASRVGHWERHEGFDSDPGANFKVQSRNAHDAEYGRSESRRVRARALPTQRTGVARPAANRHARVRAASPGVPF
jgi:hypothetical protein